MKTSMTALLAGILLTACTTETSSVSQSSVTTVTFTDDLGRDVTVSDPERTASLLGSFAEIWQLAGGDIIAAPDDAWDDLHLNLAENTVNLGGIKNLSMEELLASEPDLILASTNTRQDMEWMETLEATGIPVAYFDVTDYPDYLRMLKTCTEITGKPELYEENGTAVQKVIDDTLAAAKERVEKEGAPQVLSLTASASFVKAKKSEGNVLGAMLDSLGCENIADTKDLSPDDLSVEQILVTDPDFIFIVQRGDDEEGMKAYIEENLMSNPAWNQLTAVKNGNVFFMEKALYSLKPNRKWGEAYEKLEAILSEK